MLTLRILENLKPSVAAQLILVQVSQWSHLLGWDCSLAMLRLFSCHNVILVYFNVIWKCKWISLCITTCLTGRCTVCMMILVKSLICIYILSLVFKALWYHPSIVSFESLCIILPWFSSNFFAVSKYRGIFLKSWYRVLYSQSCLVTRSPHYAYSSLWKPNYDTSDRYQDIRRTSSPSDECSRI